MLARDGEIGREPAKEARRRRPRGAPCARAVSDMLPEVGGAAFRRFGFVQSSIVSRWREIVGARYAAVSSPESIRFPPGKKSDGRADPGRRGRPRADDAACRAGDHRAGQPLLRLSGGRAGRASGKAWFRLREGKAARRRRRRSGRSRPNSAIRCARSPIRSCAPVWNRLRAALPPAKGAPVGRRRSRWSAELVETGRDEVDAHGTARSPWRLLASPAAATTTAAIRRPPPTAAPLHADPAPNNGDWTQIGQPRRRKAASGWAIPTRR